MLQVFSFSIAGFAYKYISGTYVSLSINLESIFTIGMNFGLSTWHINLNQASEAQVVNFNAVALLLLVFINGTKNSIKKEKIESQLISIGNQLI